MARVTFTLTPGLLPTCTLTVTLTADVADKYNNCQGDFTAQNGEWSIGKPIYKNSSGCLILFKDNQWKFTSGSGGARLIAVTNEDVICPASVTKWKWTSDMFVFEHADVTITCSIH